MHFELTVVMMLYDVAPAIYIHVHAIFLKHLIIDMCVYYVFQV